MSKRWTIVFAVFCLVCVGMPLFVQGQSLNDSKIRYELLKKLICKVDKSKPMKQGGGFIVSPDCTRVAYVVCEKVKEFIVVDGKENKRYDCISDRYPIFSPDSKRVAYIAQQGEKQFVVVDDEEGKGYDGIWEGSLIFSPDSRQLAYVAQIGNEDFVVVNGIEEKHYEAVGDIAFSSDSKQLAYVAQKGNKQFVVVDGKEDKQYDNIKSLIFSPDKNKIAYIATEGDKQFVVVGGKEDKQYDNIKSLIFSPDGKRLAYIAEQDDEEFVVLDGVEQKHYYGIYSFVFSPDSKRFAYVANLTAPRDDVKMTSSPIPNVTPVLNVATISYADPIPIVPGSTPPQSLKFVVIIDGKESEIQYNGLRTAFLKFSPDSKRFACSVYYDSGSGITFVDGKRLSRFGGIPFFSPDSKRIAFINRNSIFIIDDSYFENYGSIGEKVIFDSPNSLHWVALERDVNQNALCVLVKIKIK